MTNQELEKAGASAYVAGLRESENPFARPEVMPANTGEPVQEWTRKVEAWRRGWTVEHAMQRDKAMAATMDFDNPNWHHDTSLGYKRVHDWRVYISAELQSMWPTFTSEQKHVIAENAQKIADQENWD